MSYPNTRGNSPRSDSKADRVATHIPLFKYALTLPAAAQVDVVIEHGMGLGSTPFFHSLSSVKRIVSFENDPTWRRCNLCGKDEKSHTITSLSGENPLQSLDNIVPSCTIALVDGPADERLIFLNDCLLAGIAIIVEHDAETFTQRDLEMRREACKNAGYKAYQWINDNPESALYIKSDLDLIFL
jgi:hypothetical protein